MTYKDRDYDYEYNNPSDDFIHVDEIQTEKTQDYLEGIKEALYETGDVSALENCLEELCCLYEVEFKYKECLLSKHLESQRKQIDTLMGRK